MTAHAVKNDSAAGTAGWRSPTTSAPPRTIPPGLDTLTIDLQHGVVDYQAMVGMLQAISTTPPCPSCACPGWSRHPIMAGQTYALPMVSMAKRRASSHQLRAQRAPTSARACALLYGGADGGTDYPKPTRPSCASR